MVGVGMVNSSATGALESTITKMVTDGLGATPTSPLSMLSGTASPGLRGDTVLSPKTPVPGHYAVKLPREGYMGGGALRLPNRSLLESVKNDMEAISFSEKPPERLKKAVSHQAILGNRMGAVSHSHSRTSSKGDVMRSTGASLGGASDTTQLLGAIAKDKKSAPMTIEERKRREIFAKWEKTEGIRERDRKKILERVENGQEGRDARFQRLLDNVTGRDNLAYKMALALRERESHEETRRRELHAAWDEKVHSPLANQAHGRMNPPNRALQQELNGSKSVDFQMPDEVFKLVANVIEDPARKQLVDLAREKAFHQAATSALRSSHSAPDLLKKQLAAPLPPTGRPMGSSIVPRATTRPVLEPSNWSQRDIQGTMFGHFAQVAEYGPGFKRSYKGGTNAHIPDSSDNVLVAGTRHSRTQGHGDVGILRGDTATQGESSNYKTLHGSSSAAPAQDHFTFQTGTHITNLEFPLGKKIFPEFH